MLEIIRDEYNNPVLQDGERSLKLEILGWDDGSINYNLKTLIKGDEIDHGDILTDEPELIKLVFETVYNYLLKRHGF